MNGNKEVASYTIQMAMTQNRESEQALKETYAKNGGLSRQLISVANFSRPSIN